MEKQEDLMLFRSALDVGSNFLEAMPNDELIFVKDEKRTVAFLRLKNIEILFNLLLLLDSTEEHFVLDFLSTMQNKIVSHIL